MSEINHPERRSENRDAVAVSTRQTFAGSAGLYNLVSEFWVPAAKAVQKAGEKIAIGKRK